MVGEFQSVIEIFEKIHPIAQLVWVPWCGTLFVLACLSSLIRMDYNIAIAMIGFFFINRSPREPYAFSHFQTTLFFWICFFSLPMDLSWMILSSDASEDFKNSKIPEVAGAYVFSWVMSLFYFIVKVPFVIFLYHFKNRSPLEIQQEARNKQQKEEVLTRQSEFSSETFSENGPDLNVVVPEQVVEVTSSTVDYNDRPRAKTYAVGSQGPTTAPSRNTSYSIDTGKKSLEIESSGSGSYTAP